MANFSVGSDFPAIFSFKLGTILKVKKKEKKKVRKKSKEFFLYECLGQQYSNSKKIKIKKSK